MTSNGNQRRHLDIKRLLDDRNDNDHDHDGLLLERDARGREG
jgi:hypothetical protein